MGDLLRRLGADYPQIKKHLFDDEGRLRNFVNVYVNDDDIRHLQKEQTPVEAKDVMSIIPAVAGGTAAAGASAGGAVAGGAAAAPTNGKLDAQQVQRYSRHLIMPEVGMEGQQKLRRARVLVVGAGGLGSPTLSYLAAAGVGTLGIVDFDTVDFTNLQRQIIYTTADVGRSKLEVAAERIRAMNPDVEVRTHEARLPPRTPWRFCAATTWWWTERTTTPPATWSTTPACMLGIPNVYGSIFRFDGQASVFCPPDGPCYRCVYPEPPPPGARPELRGGRRAGGAPGHHREPSRPRRRSSSSWERASPLPEGSSCWTP